jgi:hypothetical protein
LGKEFIWRHASANVERVEAEKSCVRVPGIVLLLLAVARRPRPPIHSTFFFRTPDYLD